MANRDRRDYDFRRLFYTWSPDITSGEFQDWIEIASREKTAGHIFPCDLWLAPDGFVHLLWTERALDVRLREKFFPEEKQTVELNYAVIKDGKVIVRRPVMIVNGQNSPLLPGRGRFHVSNKNRLFILYHVYSNDQEKRYPGENRIIEVKEDYFMSHPETLNLQKPLSSFYTASVRSGTSPSNIIDVLGDDGTNTMRYVRIRIE